MANPKRGSRLRIADLMQQYAQGVSIVTLCAQARISRSTFYRWRARYEADGGGKRDVADENRALRRRIHKLASDKALLQQLLRREG